MGLTICLFSPTPNLTNYTNTYGYEYKFRNNDRKRIQDRSKMNVGMFVEWLNAGRNYVKNNRKSDGNELSPKNMYACPQLDTCHVGSYFGPLVPKFGT